MSTTGTGTAVVLGAQAAWSLDASVDRIEVTAFGDANKTYVQGLSDISGDFSGFFDDTDTTLFAAAASADGVKIYLYPDYTGAPTKYWYGPAWVDYNVGAEVGGAVTVAGTFGANGAWGRF
jgi:hypothetical protein